MTTNDTSTMTFAEQAEVQIQDACCILETLKKNLRDEELAATMRIVLTSLYAATEAVQQINYADGASTSTDAPASADTQPASAASVSADLVENLNRLPAKQRDAVIGVMQSIVDCEQPSDEDTATASDDTSDGRKQDESGRGNEFDAGNVLDTLHRVNCGMAMLGRIDDSEDFCEDSDMGKFFLLNTMRCALNAAADRIQAGRQPEAAE